MAILRDIDIQISARELMQSISSGKRDASWMLEPVEAALALARGLLFPVIVYT